MNLVRKINKNFVQDTISKNVKMTRGFLLIVSLFICIAEISIAHPLAYSISDNLMSPTNIDVNLLLDQAMNYQEKSA